MSRITILNDAHWHAVRTQHVGASESAALFNLSPWVTRWQLHMQKLGKLPSVDLDDNKSIQQGRHFEPAIAAYAAEKFGINLRKVHRYLTADDCPGMGASLDYEQIGTGSLIPVEIKWSQYGDGWDYQGDEILEAPEYYLIQCQHQMGVTGADQAVLLGFVGGDLRRMIIPRRDFIISTIKREIAGFWADMRAGKEPPIDFEADAEAVSRLAAVSPICRVTLPPEAERIAGEYLTAKALENEHATVAAAKRAELTKIILDLSGVSGGADQPNVVSEVGPYRISATSVSANPGVVITEEMIGTVIDARAGYRRVTISEPKVNKRGNAAKAA